MEIQSGAVRVASYRRKLPRKANRKKNIYLPTEVWVDVFCFLWITITRPRMAQMIDKIGNRWFGEQLQFYLHEWGKHTLGHLHFRYQEVMKDHNRHFQQLEYPQTAMPENIKFCKYFQINYFDNRVFNFFNRIQSLLMDNIKLEIQYIREEEEEVANVRFILGHLLPFIDGMHTLRMDDRMLPTVVQLIPPKKFHQIKELIVRLTRLVQATVQPIMEWLTTSSNEPKLLRLFCFDNEIVQQVLETIRKQFMEATRPSTFAVIFPYNCNLPAFNCENSIGEQLCGITNVNDEYGKYEVLRHQANKAETRDQLRQWVDANMDKGVHDGKQCIRLCRPSIGEGPIFAMPDLDEADNNEKEEDEDKPSTSKKRRICK